MKNGDYSPNKVAQLRCLCLKLTILFLVWF